MTREALHIGGASLPEGNLAQHEKKMVIGQDHLTFANLKHKEVSLALQLYMQFFKMAHLEVHHA